MFTLTKPKIEDLVEKEIVLTNLKFWTYRGTVWAPNSHDYQFVFRIFEKCIGCIPLKNGDVRFINGNIYYYPAGKKVLSFYHGEQNPYSISDEPNSNYKEISQFLDEAMLKQKR